MVRQEALHYFAECSSRDTEVMPLAIKRRFRFVCRCLQSSAQHFYPFLSKQFDLRVFVQGDAAKFTVILGEVKNGDQNFVLLHPMGG